MLCVGKPSSGGSQCVGCAYSNLQSSLQVCLPPTHPADLTSPSPCRLCREQIEMSFNLTMYQPHLQGKHDTGLLLPERLLQLPLQRLG